MSLYTDKKLFLSFIKEHKVILDDIYYKYISRYNITKNEFYNFAFRNSSLNNSLSELYKKYNE
jgi:hypothetical protein